MICDMCGKERNLVSANIEGSILNVCENCAKFGKIISQNIQVKDQPKKIISSQPELVYEIVKDYFIKIKNARESMNLKQEELALKISEKVSEVHKLESNKIKPSFKLARKLEKALNITLIEQIFQTNQQKINFNDSSLTIEDIIKLKKKNE